MMKAKDLKNSILQMAMQGKLVPQDTNDEPASILLEKIKQEKEQLIKDKVIKRNNKESTIWKENGHWYEKIGKNGEIKCLDDEISFEIPNNWEVLRLENICNLLNIKKSDNNEYPYLNAKYLRTLDNPTIKNSGSFIKRGSEVILVDGENSGEVFVVPCDGYMGSTFRYLFTMKSMYKPYILKFIESYKTTLKNSKTGAAIPHLNKKLFNQLLIGIPPYTEQNRIVEKLEQILPQIEQYGIYEEQLTNLNNELPEKLKKSILQQAMQGKLVPQNPEDEPTTVLLEKIKREKEQLIKDKKIKRNNKESIIWKKNGHWYEKIGKNGETKCIDEEISFEIPETWSLCNIENITTVKGGKRVPKGYKLLDTPTNHIYIRVTDMKENTLITEKLKYIDDNIYNQIKKYIIHKNDLYLTIAGTIGNVGEVPEMFDGMNLTENAVKLTNIFINKKYLMFLIMSDIVQNQFIDKTNKVAQPKLAMKRINSTYIPLPPLNEQKRIVEKLEQILPQIEECGNTKNN